MVVMVSAVVFFFVSPRNAYRCVDGCSYSLHAPRNNDRVGDGFLCGLDLVASRRSSPRFLRRNEQSELVGAHGVRRLMEVSPPRDLRRWGLHPATHKHKHTAGS
ncbi:unnamed protein product [Ectocarpus sp. 12 AP-2014]